jgi:hypothetical protein
MDNKVVNIQVKHNIDQTTKSSNDLAGALKGAANSAGELGGKSDGLGKIQSGIDAVGGAVGQLNPAFGSAIKGSNGLILKMWEMCANPVGAILAAIVITLKFLYESFQSSVEGGKELKAIFAAVSAVGTQVKDAMFGLGRALIDVVSAAVKFITLDFKGAAESMKKANQEASNSYKQLGNAVDGTTYKIMYNLEKQQQANDKARKLQAVVQSETNLLLVKSRETLTDETASLKDKKKALEEVTKAEMASSAEKERIALKDLQIAKVRAKAMGGEEEKKAKQELRDLEIAYNEAQTENAMTGIKLNKQKKMLGRQEVADQKEAIAAKKTANKEAYDADKTLLENKLKEEGLNYQQRRDLIKADKILNAEDRKKLNDQIDKEEKKSIEEHNKAIADLNKKYDDEKLNRLADTAVKKENLDYSRKLEEINRIAQTETEKQTLIEKLDGEHKVRLATATKTDADKKLADEKLIADAKLKLAKETADAELKIQELKHKGQVELMQKTSDVLGVFSDMLGKQTAAGKTLAIAQATINAYLGISEVWKAKNVYPEPFGTGIKIASTVVMATSAFKTVKDIMAVQVPGGGGGGSAPTMGGSASAPAAPSFNVVGNSGVNQVANVMSNQGMQPVQAYVVANNVTTAQGLNRNIVNNATLG